jgi:uncharacterized protein YcbX
MDMYIKELWRYPVKSFAGERIETAEVTPDGIEGDRRVWVRGPEGVRTSRRQHGMLGLRGTTSADGAALVDGLPWDDEEVLRRLQGVAGPDAWLEPASIARRFDVLPLLLATDGAIAAFGRDGRRLRPNIVVGGVEGVTERAWPGGTLRVGTVEIALDSLRARCPMTTIDPDTLERDPGVLKDIGRRFGGRLALNAAVIAGGTVRVGDAVTVEPLKL